MPNDNDQNWQSVHKMTPGVKCLFVLQMHEFVIFNISHWFCFVASELRV